MGMTYRDILSSRFLVINVTQFCVRSGGILYHFTDTYNAFVESFTQGLNMVVISVE